MQSFYNFFVVFTGNDPSQHPNTYTHTHTHTHTHTPSVRLQLLRLQSMMGTLLHLPGFMQDGGNSRHMNYSVWVVIKLV
jgi:hypothetical protein